MGTGYLGTLGGTTLARLTPGERQRSVVYIDETLHPPGPVRIGTATSQAADPFVMVFIDRMPGANWMHPCRYLLINPDDGTMISFEADRPPVFGPLPATWRVLSRSPEVSDWQVIPIRPTTTIVDGKGEPDHGR